MAKRRKHAHRVHHRRHHARRRARPSGARPMMGYVVGTRKIRRRKLNPFRHHRRHHARRRHHNPFHREGASPTSLKGMMAEFTPALWGAGGGIALDVALAYLPVPTALQTGYANSALRIAGAIGIGALAGMATSKRTGFMVGAGALTVQLYSILRGLLASTVGSSVKGLSGLADFKDYSAGVGAYMPQMAPMVLPAVPAPAGRVGSYMNPGTMLVPTTSPIAARQRMSGFGAYMGRRSMIGAG